MNARCLAGWALAGLQLAVTAFVHKGLGTSQNEISPSFFEATGFLRESELLGAYLEPLAGGALLCAAPAIIAAGIFGCSRSAVARTIGICGVVWVALMSYYALSDALRIWQFFHWRGSAVILLSGAVIGATLSAPLLARSWLRLRAPAQLASYLPVAFAAMAIIRNATGTDENLAFNLSPWPAISLIGFDIGCVLALSVLLGLLIGVSGFVPRRSSRLLRGLLCGIGIAVPVASLVDHFPGSPLWMIASVGVGTAAALALTLRGPGSAARSAAHIALAIALVWLPLASGNALADADYTVTRHVRARAITDALADYYAQAEEYPDTLGKLVEAGRLEHIPSPRVGFALFARLGWLEPPRFHFQNFGSSYVLEFIATEWIMCSYNPPWPDEGEEYADEEYAEGIDYDEGETIEEAGDVEDGRGVWNCPESRPDLW
jgi:hypothetical protein